MFSFVGWFTKSSPKSHIFSRTELARAKMNRLYAWLMSLSNEGRKNIVLQAYRTSSLYREEAQNSEEAINSYKRTQKDNREKMVALEQAKVKNVVELIKSDNSYLPSSANLSDLKLAMKRARSVNSSFTRVIFINGALEFLKQSDEMTRMFFENDDRLLFCGEHLGHKRTIKAGQANLLELLDERLNI